MDRYDYEILKDRIFLRKKYGADCAELEQQALEFRRANNIFEVGDSILIHENHDSTFMPVLEILEDCGDYFKTDNGIATKSHVGYWRHATDEEIAAGHRQ